MIVKLRTDAREFSNSPSPCGRMGTAGTTCRAPAAQPAWEGALGVPTGERLQGRAPRAAVEEGAQRERKQEPWALRRHKHSGRSPWRAADPSILRFRGPSLWSHGVQRRLPRGKTPVLCGTIGLPQPANLSRPRKCIFCLPAMTCKISKAHFYLYIYSFHNLAPKPCTVQKPFLQRLLC